MSRETGSKSASKADRDQTPQRTREEDRNGKIDEALVESFPASDPPASTASLVPGSPRRRKHEARRNAVPEPSDADA